MAKKPWNYDQFQHMVPPYWVTVEDRVGTIIQYHLIDHTDPKRALVDALAHWVNLGWTLEQFDSRNAHFYCNKDGERRLVSIAQNDPSKPLPPSHGSSPCKGYGQPGTRVDAHKQPAVIDFKPKTR